MCSLWACYSSMQLQSSFLRAPPGQLTVAKKLFSVHVVASYRHCSSLSTFAAAASTSRQASAGPARVVIQVIDAPCRAFPVSSCWGSRCAAAAGASSGSQQPAAGPGSAAAQAAERRAAGIAAGEPGAHPATIQSAEEVAEVMQHAVTQTGVPVVSAPPALASKPAVKPPTLKCSRHYSLADS